MARRRHRSYTRRAYRGFRSRVHRPKKISLAVLAGLGAGLMIPAEKAMAGQFVGDDGALAWLLFNYTGVRKSGGTYVFDANGLKNGVLPLFIGAMVHKGAGMLGVNRAMSKIPVINI